MNRLILITILALAMPAVLSAQINWTEHTIDSLFDGANSVYAIDLDGDEDVDVLGAAFDGDDITWWENDGGSPPSFTKYTIDSLFGGARSVYAIDVDNDNDVDVLGAAFDGDEIAWWENDGGSPPSFTKYTIDSLFDGAASVYAIDLDDDGDVDVLGAAGFLGDITWWENDGGSPPSFTKYTIDSLFDGAYSVYAIDLDDDNDVDVVGAASAAHDIAWWENDGSENFTKHTIADNFTLARSVYALDLDGDEDVDVLGAAVIAGEIAWWENDGGSPPSFNKYTIDSLFDGAQSVYAIDLDDDNDVDVLGAAGIAGEITWWENDGNENFTEHNIADNLNGSVYAIDLDDDNDIDVLGAAYNADDITWWESDLLDIYDVGPVSIDIPEAIPEDTTFNPQATVTNLGTNTETFPITCKIDPGNYSSTQTVNDLGPGDSIQISFFTPFTFESGFYTVTVYTRFTDDENPANDTLEKVIEATGIAEGDLDTPETFSFSAPTINRSRINIEFALPVATRVDLLVYDATGRLSETLISQRFSAGNHKLNVNLDIPAGVYFYNLKTGSGENIIKKFLLVE